MGAKSTRTRYAYAYWADSGGQGAKSGPETPVLSGAFYPMPANYGKNSAVYLRISPEISDKF